MIREQSHVGLKHDAEEYQSFRGAFQHHAGAWYVHTKDLRLARCSGQAILFLFEDTISRAILQTVKLHLFLLKELRRDTEQRGQVMRVDLTISLPAGAPACGHEPCLLRAQGSG